METCDNTKCYHYLLDHAPLSTTLPMTLVISTKLFLYAGICFHNGTSWSVNFRPGRKHNALSMEFCFLPVGRGKWKTAGRCHPEDSYVQTSRPFNISCDVIGGMRRRPITLSLGKLLICSFFSRHFAVEYSDNVYKYVCRSPYTA